MIIGFAGHSLVPSTEKVREAVKEQILKNITESRQVTFYLGGYGDFDEICAGVCRSLKREHSGMELVYVTPYITSSEQEKIKYMQKLGLYDASIYPPIENTPLRFAISKRNAWMMSNVDLVIAYVKFGYGGAYKSLQVAKSKKKKIINIADFI